MPNLAVPGLRESQVTEMTDQNGTVHNYGYDKLGRNLSDNVSVVDMAIDNTVGGLQTVYDRRGLRSHAKSLNTARTAVLSDVEWVRDDFGQIVAEYQEHGGAVVQATSPKVQYTYADPSASGTPNTIRQLSIKYPNDTEITTNYSSEMANALSRPDALKEGTTVHASYTFLGASTNVGVTYEAAGNVAFTLESGSPPSDGGDIYTGLDRFGQLIETIWKPGPGSTNLVQSSYGRNRFGGVVWRRDDAAHAMGKLTNDNYYWYDGLYQVQQHERGQLNAYLTGITSPVQTEGFTFDEMGNWLAYDTQTPSLNQDRTYNKANEITSIMNPSSVVQPNYDPAGNMTTMPKAGNWTTSCALKWDAWNRVAQIAQGSDTPIQYSYDALTRRTKTTVGTTERHFYYNNEWRAVEEQSGTTTDTIYVWGILNRWDMVLRKQFGLTTQIHYVLKDYLDPVAIIDDTGAVKERFSYDAFGPVQFLDANFNTASPNESSVGWNFLFHAEFQDTATGLYNYGYRFYQPELGRWLSRDPIGERGGRNLFEFSKNNGVLYTDKFGQAIHVNDSRGLPDYLTPIPVDGVSGNEPAFDFSNRNLGNTRAETTVTCSCKCVDVEVAPDTSEKAKATNKRPPKANDPPAKPKFEKHCTMTCDVMTSFVILINTRKGNPEAKGHTIGGIFGHEQRHVQSFNEMIKRRILDPLRNEDYPKIGEWECQRAATDKMNRYTQIAINVLKKWKEGDHKGMVHATEFSPKDSGEELSIGAGGILGGTVYEGVAFP